MIDEKSRKITPWKGKNDLTPTQKFLKQTYDTYYAERRRKVSDCEEAEMINSYVPKMSPFCKSVRFRKFGYTKSGVQRYQCTCGKTFLPTTETIFDEHKISISEWMEYCLNLFRHVSITADSWSNKNAFATSRYWLQKLFMTLEDVQNGIVLAGDVWLDETYYRVRSEDVIRNNDGNKLPVISRNQICIGVATDKTHNVILVEGFGRQSQTKTLEAFKNHIKPSSTLIHDKETTHKRLVKLCRV